VTRRLTSQEKLALLMTSAGSQRNAAALVGVTHQKLGRWLREGEAGGVKSIPDDAATRAAIDNAFAMHVEVSKEQARRDGVPFLASAPVYMERRYLSRPDPRTGRPVLGDRVFAEHTQFISQKLRRQWTESVVRSERFYKVNVRSTVDLRSYRGFSPETGIVDKRKRERQRHNAQRDLKHFLDVESRKRGRIVDKTEPFPLYTRSLPTVPGYKATDIANALESLLNEKHAPAASGPGTAFASEYLLQLFPADYAQALRRQGYPVPITTTEREAARRKPATPKKPRRR